MTGDNGRVGCYDVAFYGRLRKALLDRVNATTQERDLFAERTAVTVREVVRIDAERIGETQAENEARRGDRPVFKRANRALRDRYHRRKFRDGVPEARPMFANALAQRPHTSAAPGRRWRPLS